MRFCQTKQGNARSFVCPNHQWIYKLSGDLAGMQARENHERGLPLALMALKSRGMMKDRVYGVTQTIFHVLYYPRHVVTPARIVAIEEGVIRAEANHAVFRTRPAGVGEVYHVGHYIDQVTKKKRRRAEIQASSLCV